MTTAITMVLVTSRIDLNTSPPPCTAWYQQEGGQRGHWTGIVDLQAFCRLASARVAARPYRYIVSTPLWDTEARGFMSELTVVHQPAQGKFDLVCGGQTKGYLDYSMTDADTLCINYVEVSPALRGKQMGNKLVDAAVEWARSNKHRVIATCGFARSVLNRTAKYSDVRK